MMRQAVRWPKVLYDISEYTALGERMLLPERRARKALASLRKWDPDWKVTLDDLPRFYHVQGPIYTDGEERYRVKRLKRPYDPGTYTFEPREEVSG